MTQIYNVTYDDGKVTEEATLLKVLNIIKREVERSVRVNCEATIRIHDDVNDLVHEIKITDGGEEVLENYIDHD